jgi:transcriptional regulator with XRE-family HTH domain
LHFARGLNEQDQQYLLALGRNILKVRMEMNMSQQDVANKCRVERARIGKIENGKIDVQLMTIVNIATALGVDVRSLIPPQSTYSHNKPV